MKARSGNCRNITLVASLAFIALASPAFARGDKQFSIADGSLGAAIATIARETGAEIVTLEPGISTQRVKARAVGPDAMRALRQLLKNTPYRAVFLGGNSFRIERRPLPKVRLRRVPSQAAEAGDAIVVEAKFPTLLTSYPGSVERVVFGEKTGAGVRATDFAAVARSTPVLSTTSFGDGRDKVFIRGVADSSFNGASQPTTSIYFGDALIGFGSPNPNLRLYDVSSLEILEGPQGTLYGSGSVGGVIRIVPNAVDLTRAEGAITGAMDLTKKGAPGRANVGVMNLPVTRDRLGVRIVGYEESKGGYIDDPGLGKNLNAVKVAGGRAMLAAEMGNDFRLDLTGIYQTTSARDSQYADNTGPLRRTAAIQEPYSSNVALGIAVLKKRWSNGNELNAIVSIGKRNALDRFDASAGRVAASALETQRTSVMIASESRLSGSTPSGLRWVTGLAFEYVEDGQSRAFGAVDSTNPLDEVTNLTKTLSLFAQGKKTVLGGVEATAGLRFTLSRTDSRPARNGQVSYISGDLAKRFDPTVAILWHAVPGLSVYGRVQTGYRNGGVTVARGVGRVANFEPDSIVLSEVGARYTATPGLILSGALAAARWNNVLGDLVTQRGTAVASNLGDATILSAETRADWDSGSGWAVRAAALWLNSRISGAQAMQSAPRNRLLPTSPKFSANARLQFTAPSKSGDSYWSSGLSGQYVGRSVLGLGSLLEINQGDYASFDWDASLVRKPFALAIRVANLLDNHASRFAIGNPLTLYKREGFVPLSPRTATLSVTVSW